MELTAGSLSFFAAIAALVLYIVVWAICLNGWRVA